MASFILEIRSHFPTMVKPKDTTDPFTDCTNLLKKNEGISISSQLLRTHIDNKTTPSAREMGVISEVLDAAVANAKEFAHRRCPAGGDPSWLLKRQKRDSSALNNKENGGSVKRRKATTQLFDSLSEFKNENFPSSMIRAKSSQRIRTKPSRFSPSDKDEEFPLPKNGYMFEVLEALEHLEMAKYRHPVIKYWVEHEWIPVSASKCAKLWLQYVHFKVNGGEAPSWKMISGPKHLADTEDFLVGCKEMEKDNHMTLEKKDIAEVLYQIKSSRLKANNVWKSENECRPSPRSVSRYFALYCSRTSKRLRQGKVQHKTMTRFTGEHSLMSAASFAGVHAVVGMIVGEDARPSQFKKPIEAATVGAQRLERIVREENHGMDVYPVQPGLILSYDDTTCFACEGIHKDTGKADWKLLNPEESYSSRSAYSVDKEGVQK